MIELLSKNIETIALILSVFAGLFAFIKWLDSRNMKIKNDRYEKYINLIKRLSGSSEGSGYSVCMTEQIASAWLLLEYNEFDSITLKIFDNKNLEKMSNENWQKFVIPQIRQVIDTIKQRSTHN